MAVSSQTLSDEDLNLLRNDRIKFECCPLVYQNIIEWGFEKPDGVKIIDHFKNQKIEEKIGRNLKNWLKFNEKVLKETEFSSFDVTTLHSLLPVLCYDKITDPGVQEYIDKIKDENSIEYILKKIKDFRNGISHEYVKAKNDSNIEEKLILLRKCITTAGKLYGKDQSEIDTKVADLDAKFYELLHGTTSSIENAVKHVTKLIEKGSAPFLLEKYSELFSVLLPGTLKKVDTAQIFESVNLSVAVENREDKKTKKDVFSSPKLYNHVKNKFVVIKGGPGSGKTTLLRNLYENILKNSVDGSELSYEGIGIFRVPIFLECRTERQNNLSDFLKDSLPNFYSSKEIIYEAIKDVERKVFLIDGYDEVNDKSRELIKDAIEYCIKYKVTCIVTGRVDAANNFIRNLQKRNLSYDEMFIEPISNKLRFLMRYGENMGDDVDSEILVNSFENLNEAVQEVFVSPFLLALFIPLFLNNRKCLTQLHNEQRAYKAIKEVYSQEIEMKLIDSNVPSPKIRTKDLLAVFSYHSLSLLKSDKYFFKEDDYYNLVRDCEEKLSKDVDFENLLTCILTPEISLKKGKTLTYAFTHSTIQEYLAVEQIIKNMKERNIDWNSEQLSEDYLRENFLECLGISGKHTDIKEEVERYGNIIKLLMLETLDNKTLSNYTRTFTAVLRKCFETEYSFVSPVYLFGLVHSSNCDSIFVSIVSIVLRNEIDYWIDSIRHIKPLTEVLRKNQTGIQIWLNFSESLSKSNCDNLGQLLSVLQDDSKIRIHFEHSYDNYQPLNGDFYTQLNNSKCKITYFKACVTSEDLSIVMKVCKVNSPLYISTKSASAIDFTALVGHEGTLNLKVKYNKDCHSSDSTDSNPVSEKTKLTITDIPADGKDIVYRITNFLSPKSKEFESIELVNCYLTDTDTNELLMKIEGAKIRTRGGERTEVKEKRVNEDESRDLELHLVVLLSTKSLSPKTLSDEDLNFLMNDLIKFETCPLVYQTIIEWGFEKPKGIKIIDHFNYKKIEEKCGRNLKNWLKINEKVLEATDFTSFNVTTLHNLLPVLCYDKVCQTGEELWKVKIKDTNSIEYLLNVIKDFRNELYHFSYKANVNPNIESQKKMMAQCIKTAGALYSKDQIEVDKSIANLNAKFDELMQGTSSYVHAVQHLTEFVEKETAPFILEKYSDSFSVPLPDGLGNVCTSQIFETVNLSVTLQDKNKKAKKKTVFSSPKLCNHVKNKFVVIKGSPGSGKTTLLRSLYENIVHYSVNRSELSHEGIERFRVPIYLECRTKRHKNLRDFLKESIPNINASNEIIYDAFKEVEGQVFLIDGYDEVNDKSRELVKDAIEYCIKYKATCIVTGRVDAGNNFIEDMKQRNLSYDEMSIETINEMSDKLSFLRRYGDIMDIDSDELVNSFQKLSEAVQKVFFCPVLLILFISLFLNNRNCLSQLHSEQSAYKEIKEIFSERIEKKLIEINVPNTKLRANDILAVFSYYSLLLFNNEEYFFKEDDYENLVGDCEKKLSKYVNFEKLLMCILTPVSSLLQGEALAYTFTHITIQEYLAVEQINKNMREQKIDWNSDQLSEDNLQTQFLESIGVSTSLSGLGTSLPDVTTPLPDVTTSLPGESTSFLGVSTPLFCESTSYFNVKKKVKRYSNIIKLLMLETVANSEVRKYSKTFTAVLRKYFRNDTVYLLDVASSSNCDSTIVSIVSNVLRNERRYDLESIRHIRPLTEIVKISRETEVDIEFDIFSSLTDNDCINLGQLVSVLKEDSLFCLNCNHSYDNYQPLNGEFYTQLNNSKCKLTKFTACVTSDDHLSIVKKVYRGGYRNTLKLSFPSINGINFAIFEGHEEEIYLKFKYTTECPSTGSNPVTEKTALTIECIPADGKDNVYRIVSFLSPESKELQSINLIICHLTDTVANELLIDLHRENLRTRVGERTEVKVMRVNRDNSRNLELLLPDFEKREAEQREAEQREAEQREAEQQEAEQQEAEQREAEQRETEQRETEQREPEQREVVQQGSAHLQATQQEVEQREASQREAAQGDNEHLEFILRENSQLKTELQAVKQREEKQRETAQREAAQRESEQRQTEHRQATQRETEQRKVSQLKDKLQEYERENSRLKGKVQEFEQREVEQRRTEQREAEQRKLAVMAGIICLIMSVIIWYSFRRF